MFCQKLLIAGLALLTFGFPQHQETELRIKWESLSPEVQEKRAALATDAARVYFQALMRGDVDAVIKSSGLPYALDRRRVVESEKELRGVFEEILRNREQRSAEPVSTEVIADRRGIGDDCLALDHVVVRLLFDSDGDERIEFGLRMGEEPVVIGFSD